VDLYFEAARLSATSVGQDNFDRVRQLHEAALMKMVVTGQKFKRLDPKVGLSIRRHGSEHQIPITHHGFVWDPREFEQLLPIGIYETSEIRTRHQRRGAGVPFVLRRKNVLDRAFVRDQGAIPSTLVLQVDESDIVENTVEVLNCRLELYDPLRVDSVEIRGRSRPLSKDTTAPIVYVLQGQQWSYLNYFINPGNDAQNGGLYMVEPYQPNKIPIVLIHGLLSDPFTWVQMINELLVHPGFLDHYQVWAFEYATGESFLRSAAELREQLALARSTYDPARADRQMSQMILVGHSMGGLIAKLQVTTSGDRLWNAIANRPLDELRMPDYTRQELRQVFFFEPSADVDRVVFMATPHRGSAIASGPIGQLSSKLINLPEVETQSHQILMQCNPGVFAPEVQDRNPVSIDLLDPHSQLLMAIETLPAADHVCMHTILGTRCWSLFQGRSDGIVPETSAMDPRAISLKRVNATHSQVKSHPEAINEVLFILLAHLQASHDTLLSPESAAGAAVAWPE
jgi:pimeloyl-ACP methyl ester carboxylesterase